MSLERRWVCYRIFNTWPDLAQEVTRPAPLMFSLRRQEVWPDMLQVAVCLRWLCGCSCLDFTVDPGWPHRTAG